MILNSAKVRELISYKREKQFTKALDFFLQSVSVVGLINETRSRSHIFLRERRKCRVVLTSQKIKRKFENDTHLLFVARFLSLTVVMQRAIVSVTIGRPV